jgi:hypothetical protein
MVRIRNAWGRVNGLDAGGDGDTDKPGVGVGIGRSVGWEDRRGRFDGPGVTGTSGVKGGGSSGGGASFSCAIVSMEHLNKVPCSLLQKADFSQSAVCR